MLLSEYFMNNGNASLITMSDDFTTDSKYYKKSQNI